MTEKENAMRKFTGFEHGIGMGGWLTNYKRLQVVDPRKRMWITPGDMEHFASYITRDDVAYIASLGADHIRLGFDQIVLEEFEHPGVYREEILRIMSDFFDWCKEFGLNVMFNMHKAIGAYCDVSAEMNDLCRDPALRKRFTDCWIMLEKRFSDRDHVAFELLNELTTPDSEDWNTLADETIRGIRELNPNRIIVIGSAQWNSPDKLKDLRIWDDENVIYTFHFYAPHEFTHQRGLLQGNQHVYNREMPYPCDMERYKEYRRYFGIGTGDLDGWDTMGREWIRHRLQPAADWVKEHPDKILYNGEYGTIRHAKPAWREAYVRDVTDFCRDHEIPYCLWNYLSTPYDGNRFSLVDDDYRKILSPVFADIIAGR